MTVVRKVKLRKDNEEMKDTEKAQPAGGRRAGADVIGADDDVDSAITSHPYYNTEPPLCQEEISHRVH